MGWDLAFVEGRAGVPWVVDEPAPPSDGSLMGVTPPSSSSCATPSPLGPGGIELTLERAPSALAVGAAVLVVGQVGAEALTPMIDALEPRGVVR